MKKKIIGTTVVLIVCAVTMLNVNILFNSKNDKHMAISIEQVESLAGLEYLIGAYQCPKFGWACPYAYGGNVQWAMGL